LYIESQQQQQLNKSTNKQTRVTTDGGKQNSKEKNKRLWMENIENLEFEAHNLWQLWEMGKRVNRENGKSFQTTIEN
jgi:hypothetical protein